MDGYYGEIKYRRIYREPLIGYTTSLIIKDRVTELKKGIGFEGSDKGWDIELYAYHEISGEAEERKQKAFDSPDTAVVVGDGWVTPKIYEAMKEAENIIIKEREEGALREAKEEATRVAVDKAFKEGLDRAAREAEDKATREAEARAIREAED